MAAEVAGPGYSRDDLHQLFGKLKVESHIAVAVSGGSDSMALLHMLLSWRSGLAAYTQRPQITALTVDHGLREGSASEAAQVQSWCRGLNVDHVTLCWMGKKPTTAIQAQARQARYSVLANWCHDHQVAYLLTAHHLDDQAETVAMRSLRTDSNASLAGIHDTFNWRNLVTIFRPLLRERRERLRSYLTSLGQHWIEDPSNVNPKFERVRVRHGLLAAPQKAVQLAEIATVAATQHRHDTAVVTAWFGRAVTIFPEGYCRFLRQDFCLLSSAQKSLALQRLLYHFGGAVRAELAAVQRAVAWLGGEFGSRRSLAGAIIAAREDVVLIGREWARIESTVETVPDQGCFVWDGRFCIQATPGTLISSVGHAEKDLRYRLKRQPSSTCPAFVHLALPVIRSQDGSGNMQMTAIDSACLEFIWSMDKVNAWNWTQGVLC